MPHFSPARLVTLASLLVVVPGAGVFAQTFDYDRTRPTTLVDRDVVVREVSYQGPDGEPTEATLVTPSKPGKYPAVLFVHWYGPEDTNSNRTQYVPDALELAGHGIVSFLVDTPWSEPSWFPKRAPADDVALSARQVRRLRRAMDVLAAIDRADPARLAYVGHDFGAMYGAIVAGLDPRITAFAYVAGTAKFGDWFTLGRKLEPAARDQVYKELAPFDPVAHLPRIGAKAVLLQFASKDPYVTKAAADALIAAVAVPKEARFYECGHAMSKEALDDRVAWLIKTLNGR